MIGKIEGRRKGGKCWRREERDLQTSKKLKKRKNGIGKKTLGKR